MNIFLPYEHSIKDSVEALDDKRLNKQILECMQLIIAKDKLDSGETKIGYKNHPIFTHYKNYIEFVISYGWHCCQEYSIRFNKDHKLEQWFSNRIQEIPFEIFINPKYIPFYMEGSKGQPNYIRTFSNVSILYQNKLINKWNNDKAKRRPPKWTNADIPEFYIKAQKL